MATTDNQSSNKTWELTLYELHRTPQEIITDNTEIAVSPRSLHKELMCPICLDMLKFTMTTKECLHRFCQECIITALRSGNKECPTCRKKLVSKRSLRPDPNFDMLISKIYPNREEYEAQQERVIEKLSKQHHQALAQSIEEGMRLQALNRTQKMKKQQHDDNSVSSTPPAAQNQNSNPAPTPTPGSSNSNDASDHYPLPSKRIRVTSENESTNQGPDQDSLTEEETGENEGQDADSESSVSESEIELVFKPYPPEIDQMDHILSQVRYIKTTSNATVEHLARYLAMRLQLDYNQDAPGKDLNFMIYIAKAPGNFQPLLGNMTLEQVNSKFWKVNKPLEMYYGFKKP